MKDLTENNVHRHHQQTKTGKNINEHVGWDHQGSDEKNFLNCLQHLGL